MIGWDIEQYFPAFRARRFPHKGWTTKCQDSAPRSDDAPQKGGFQPLYADLFQEDAQIELALGGFNAPDDTPSLRFGWGRLLFSYYTNLSN